MFANAERGDVDLARDFLEMRQQLCPPENKFDKGYKRGKSVFSTDLCTAVLINKAVFKRL
jgi:hypothetical protein